MPAAERPGNLLLLGGSAWLGREIARLALAGGWQVTCLVRGSGRLPPAGVELVRADRDTDAAYEAVADRHWDAVIDLASQPVHARGAAEAMGPRAAFAIHVSSASAYADHAIPGEDETAAVLPALDADRMTGMADYGSAKVACEQAWLGSGAGGVAVVRPGLIGGPGDPTGRSTYWPWRFARAAARQRPVLVPAAAGQSAQVIDVRDLAAWLLALAGRGTAGLFNAVGDPVPVPRHLDVAREVGGHLGPLRVAPDDWLLAADVAPWAGPRSLPLWLPDPDYLGFAARSNARARVQGLHLRDLRATLADALAAGPAEPLPSGLTDEQEDELLVALP